MTAPAPCRSRRICVLWGVTLMLLVAPVVPALSAEPKKDELSFSEREILNLMNTNKEMTGVIAATMTDWTRNHCSMILTSLWKKGLLARRKESGNHTRWYVYSKKEGV